MNENNLMKWNSVKDGLPPIGIPLLVTVKDNLQGKPSELRYPVYYEKARGNCVFSMNFL